MDEITVPSREGLMRARDKALWAFGRQFSEIVRAKHEAGEPLSKAQMYAIDLYAEKLGLEISQSGEIWESCCFSGFRDFLSSGKCSDAEFAMLGAEALFVEQSLAEPDPEKDGDRYPVRCITREFLALIREELDKDENEELGLVEIALNLFESNVGWLWESYEVSSKFGHMVHCVGRKESRELAERVKNIQL
jgi:hypothetical protein